MIYAIYRICLHKWNRKTDRAIELAGEIVFDNMGAQNYGIYLEKNAGQVQKPLRHNGKNFKKNRKRSSLVVLSGLREYSTRLSDILH